MKENKKNHDPVFKEKAVKLSYGYVYINKLEKELNLHRGSIAGWRRDYEKFGSGSFPGRGRPRFSPEQKTIYLLEKKIKDLDLKNEIFKNARGYISQGKPMVLHFMSLHEKVYPIEQMCQVLGITYGTYHKWARQFVSEAKKRKILLQQEITSIFFEAKQRYGSARIAIELQNRGYKISRFSVLMNMRELGLQSTITKKDYKQQRRPI